ncbi:MAG: hypothetical protein ACYC1I_03735 [Acidimicrobiales bacterium]
MVLGGLIGGGPLVVSVTGLEKIVRTMERGPLFFEVMSGLGAVSSSTQGSSARPRRHES